MIKGSIDEVIAFTHNYGCSQTGDDQEYTRKILADLIKHPNAGGVLVVGLGCENSNIDVLKSVFKDDTTLYAKVGYTNANKVDKVNISYQKLVIKSIYVIIVHIFLQLFLYQKLIQ